ncbi:hypothetical protein Tco_0072283 [Tanacetum coccineum]
MLIKWVLSSQSILLNRGRLCSRCSTVVLPREHLDMIRQINILQIFHVVVNRVHVDYAALLWWGFLHYVQQKKDRLEEDYQSIKDDILLVSVYTTGDVTVRGMLIPNEFLTDDIRATEEYKEYEKQVAGETSSPKPSLKIRAKQMKPSTTPIPLPCDDKERNEIAKATLLSLTMHKTALAAKAQEKVAKVQEKLMEEDIEKMVDDAEEELYASVFADSVFQDDDDDSGNRIEPRSHKENTKMVDDDDDGENENKKKDDDDKKDDNEDDDNDDHTDHTLVKTQELTDTVSPTPDTTSKDQRKTRRVSNKYKHLPGALHKMCRHQATDDLIENNLKRVVADTVIQEGNAFQAENNVIQVHPITSTSNSTTTFADLQQQLYLKMKSNLQDQANDPELWEVLKRKFEKSSTLNTFCRDDAFRTQHHDDHQEDDAPLEGEKRAKRQKTSKRSKSARDWDAWVDPQVVNEDEVIPEDETTELINEFQNFDKRIPTILDHARMEAKINDMMSNQFRNAKEYAYHLEQSMNYMNNQIVWESRQEDIKRLKPYAHVFYGPQRNPNEPPRYPYNKYLFFLKYGNTEENSYILSLHKIYDVPFPEEDLEEKMNHWVQKEFKAFNEEARITTEQQHRLDYIEQIIVMRENEKPDSFSKADFKYLNKNDIEDMYYICLNKKVNFRENKLLNSLMTFIRSCVIWERVHDFQLGIESYQIKINLTAPTLIFSGIEAHDPYSIVDKPTMGMIYLNSKNEKRVMYLVEIVKFCDATLERVLNEVKLKIFETEFWKKPPLLGELDLDIMKAFEREITKRLRHREHMRK